MAAYSDHVPTQAEVDKSLGDKGYIIIENMLSLEVCNLLKESIVDQVLWQVYGRVGIKITDENREDLILGLVDSKLRDKLLGKDVAKDTVWRNGNTRQPRHNKTTGMNDIYFNPDVMEHVSLNRKFYREFREIYNYPYLAHSAGPERISIKPPGSDDMVKHIDRRLSWDGQEDVNYPVRVQSAMCLDRDLDGPLRDSGTLELLTGFNHYWDFASVLFHPETGLVPFPDFGTRFFTLPKDFDKKYLPALIKYSKLSLLPPFFPALRQCFQL